jgi:glycosyltransferase involved in cell wall biosynthesis
LLNNLDKIGVSVVIVTYNGKLRLSKTFDHLRNQINIDFPWEILLVDNNSSDGTAEFVSSYWNKIEAKCELRIINEQKPGTMNARYCGIVNARYRYLLFCDDDNWLSSNYIKWAFDKIYGNSEIAAIGGYGNLAFDEQFVPPQWIFTYQGKFGCGPQNFKEGELSGYKRSLYTAGAIFDRVWLNKLYILGFVSALQGRDGRTIVAGEDTELTLALDKIGGKLFYFKKLHFFHYMPPERLSKLYLKLLSKASSEGSYYIDIYNKKRINKFTEFVKTILLLIKYYFLSLLSSKEIKIEYDVIVYSFLGKIKGILNSNNYLYRINRNLELFESKSTSIIS